MKVQIHTDLLKTHIFADRPDNWLLHAKGCHYSGLQLVNTYKSSDKTPGFISTEEIFLKQYSYKKAIFLLSQSIELALKALISAVRQQNPDSKLKKPVSYIHKVKEMITDLTSAEILKNEDYSEELIELVFEYLMWYGRYHAPREERVEQTINDSYSTSDEDEDLVYFKYQANFPETHLNLDKLYKVIVSKIQINVGDVQLLLHCP